MSPHVLYLHGFASSARSTKAAWFAERFRTRGIVMRCPDLNEPAFETLTVTRMLENVDREIEALPDQPVVLFGSSLGGLVAYHAAVRNPRIERLVLLAPALDSVASLRRGFGAEKVEQWRHDGALDVFHHGYKEQRRVGYELVADAETYDAFTTPLDRPMLIFQGRQDDSVSPAMVERFAATRPLVTLHLLDDDHQLMSSLEFIWRESARFLGLEREP
jgi:pimeloyl-ACP methyl ester carboxylesterase